MLIKISILVQNQVNLQLVQLLGFEKERHLVLIVLLQKFAAISERKHLPHAA